MKHIYVTVDGIPVVCRKHENETMRVATSGYQYCPICKRNSVRRAQNQILRDITGTSARAAREDMGLSKH